MKIHQRRADLASKELVLSSPTATAYKSSENSQSVALGFPTPILGCIAREDAING